MQAYINSVDPETGRIELTAEEAARPAAALQQSMQDLMAAPEAADPVCLWMPSGCRLMHASHMPGLTSAQQICCMAACACFWLSHAGGSLL